MADKDLDWIRDWDIISAAADGLFIHSLFAEYNYSIKGTAESTTLTQIHTFT